jgi:hypothetical protein
MASDRYVCSLSAVSAAPLPDDAALDVPPDDPMGDLPVGWARVTIETRIENTDWALLQAARYGLIEQSVKEMGEAPENRRLAELLVDGQLAGALDRVERYGALVETVYIAPGYIDAAMTALGDDDDNDEDEDDDSAEDSVIEQPIVVSPTPEPTDEAPAAN